jgi:hypothetical protein
MERLRADNQKKPFPSRVSSIADDLEVLGQAGDPGTVQVGKTEGEHSRRQKEDPQTIREWGRHSKLPSPE